MRGRRSLRFRAEARVIPAQQRAEEARRRAYRDTLLETRLEEEWVLPRRRWSRRNWLLQADDDQSRVARDHEVQNHAAGHRDFPGLSGRVRDYRSLAARFREIRHLAGKHISKEANCGRPRLGPEADPRDGVRHGEIGR